MRAKTLLMVVATWCLAGCLESSGSDDDSEPGDPSDPGDPGVPGDPGACDPSAVLDRIWELSGVNRFYYLKLSSDGTYRKETDSPPSTVLCEYGRWSATACGVLEFQTCRGTVEERMWKTRGNQLELGQGTYSPSSFSEDTAFSFCRPTDCT